MLLDGSPIQNEENRNRMWAFIFLTILGININQASGTDNSTQMYYAKVTIEESAINNLTAILTSFVSNTSLRVDNLDITTKCLNVSTSTVECTCQSSYSWNDSVCRSMKCCGQNKCTFPQNSTYTCVSNTSVTIIGTIVLGDVYYYDCLTTQSTNTFLMCNSKLLNTMKTFYSTLSGFDSLTINKYSSGSIIANFQMIIASNIMPQDLIDKSNLLGSNLTATLNLVTTGVVHLSMPSNPVHYNSTYNLGCTSQEPLNTLPAWQLERQEGVFDITNGTESTVSSAPKETNVNLKSVSELWSGKYTCAYNQMSTSCNISHKASAILDVALLPNIDMSIDPAFPLCQSSSTQNVKGICDIGSSNETYDVTWNSTGITAEIIPLNPSGDGTYTAQTVVKCSPKNLLLQLTCTFKNRVNQTRQASININIIYANDNFCKSDGDWGNTKAGFTAVLKCTNAAGQRQRTCNNSSQPVTWDPEVSACVNQDVNNVLQSAIISDIGLGLLNNNAASVFSRLQNITNNTQTINTFPNLNASIHVLFSLSQKNNLQPNVSTANAFLESSSNMLNLSLQQSWATNIDDGNLSLAEIYLMSVEELIQVANITGVPNKTNVEVDSSNCSQGAICTNTVLNITVVLNNPDPGSVKTAGFRELENYLPKTNDGYETNSHVVSTTTERTQSNSVKVQINFPLINPRPRNVLLKCVSWDNGTRMWSSDGCVWVGGSNPSEAQCVCTHLSSFAILMSSHPLNISGLTEITYAGLSVSIVSLLISLVIELIVWSAVVKTSISYLRHTAHVNISLCLLVADTCFLASSNPDDISEIWCVTFVVLKHFCYLSMFFWMLCVSSTLLHQAVFTFHNVSKKNYLRFSLVLGYVCPLLIVAITFIASNGAEGLYFSRQTCWLIYSGLLKGSIHSFVIPVGIIVFVNVFSMLVVIMKLLDHPNNKGKSNEKEKNAALTVIRTVIILTPIFGVTWIFGFAVMLLDLTSGVTAFAANYAFTLLNAFQGLFILLTTCVGDKQTREALLKHLKHNAPVSTSESSTKLESIKK